MHAHFIVQLPIPFSHPLKSPPTFSTIYHGPTLPPPRATVNNPPPITAMASTTVKEVHTDLSPLLKLYTDGTVERLFGSPYVPPSPEDPQLASPPRTLPFHRPSPPGSTSQNSPKSAFSFLDHRYVNILSAATGALVISVEYRLAPEHPLPAAYEDSWDALKWVCSHGNNIDQTSHFEKDDWITDHGDLNRIFVGGDSAGGNIAHNIAMRAGSDPLPWNTRITGAILSYPYFWGSNPIGSEPKEDIEQGLACRLWMFAYPSAAGGIDNPLINPLVDGAPGLSGLGCSKLMVCLAEKDQLTSRGLVFAEKVKKSGWKGEVEVVVTEGEDHCFQIFDPENDKAKYMIKRLANFISGSEV
ncbi:hypothetical protein CASFOL_021655 [Castilleja foliolosa]|uniref:Alpha/beta hydrolase fold-3 domain-containing protein n=1 Tax=Castilleja foliolosa TaxID=1961234 RepID=A0ABD3D0M9_9LAMI